MLINQDLHKLKEVNSMNSLKVILVSLLIFGTLPSVANEEVTPFIKNKYWKENISLEAFRSNPREYFRSEAAFNLLVGYVESELGKPISNAEFIALMNDSSQVRTRNCPSTETIRVGGLEDNQFYWFSRPCRPGEEIVQLRLDRGWIDVFSLNCLNAKEDTTPVPPPLLVANPPASTVLAPLLQRLTFSDSVSSDVHTFQSGIVAGSQCGGLFFAPGGSFQMGDTIESRGYSRTGEYYNEY